MGGEENEWILEEGIVIGKKEYWSEGKGRMEKEDIWWGGMEWDVEEKRTYYTKGKIRKSKESDVKGEIKRNGIKWKRKWWDGKDKKT